MTEQQVVVDLVRRHVEALAATMQMGYGVGHVEVTLTRPGEVSVVVQATPEMVRAAFPEARDQIAVRKRGHVMTYTLVRQQGREAWFALLSPDEVVSALASAGRLVQSTEGSG